MQFLKAFTFQPCWLYIIEIHPRIELPVGQTGVRMGSWVKFSWEYSCLAFSMQEDHS